LRLRVQRVDLQTEHAIEWDHLFDGKPDFRLGAVNFAPVADIKSSQSGTSTSGTGARGRFLAKAPVE
jgi:hypothetical protein